MCCGKLKLVPLADASSYAYTIPIQEVSSKRSKCKFMALFCASPDKVNIALQVVGIKIKDMEAMKKLADYYDSGQASAYYKVDLGKLLDTIILSPEEQDNPSCKLVCTY